MAKYRRGYQSKAGAVGDDRVQDTAPGSPDPDTFIHGTAEQRIGWFRAGFESGKPSRCDTLNLECSEL